MFSTFRKIILGINVEYDENEKIPPIMFNNSNNLSIIFIKNWFIIDSDEDSLAYFKSDVVSVKFLNCSINELNSSILNEHVMQKLQSLTISNHLSKLKADVFDTLISLNELTLELENLSEFIQSQSEWTPKKQNITIKFIDSSNAYEFPSEHYCFFKNLYDSGQKIEFETNNYPNNTNISCTLDFLTDKLTNYFNYSDRIPEKCLNNCAITNFTNEINSTTTVSINNFTEINFTTFTSDVTSGVTLDVNNTTANNTVINEKTIILFFSLIGVSVALVISILIIIVVCYKYKKLRSFKSDVAYELNEGNYVDKFE